MHAHHTPVHICLGVIYKETLKYRDILFVAICFAYTTANIYTNEVMFINRHLNLLLSLYYLLWTYMMKHNGFDKNWNNLFKH